MSMKRPWVVKVGGELLNAPRERTRLLSELRRLAKKESVVLVHGGGPQIEAGLKKEKIPIQFIHGRRVTTPSTMMVVEKVLSGVVNKGLVADLVKKGVHAVGLSGRDSGIVTGIPISGLGRAARVQMVKPKLIQHLVQGRFLPVISSVASDAKGAPVNINADDFASGLAIALKARHLVFLTDVAGVKDAQKKRIPVLKTHQIQELIDDGVVYGGMIPKLQSAASAIMKGVGEVDILKGGGGLLWSLGTRILK